MQLNRYALLACALPVALVANAQSLTLDAAGTVPAIGTTVLMHKAAFVAADAAGETVFHDYSALTETGSSTYVWTVPSISPNAGMFPSATLALNNAGPDTIFYEVTGAGLERVGDTRTIDVLAANFPAAYTSSVLELPLPLAYGDTWTDNIAGTFDVDGSTGDRTGTITGTADAAGFVAIPGTPTPIHVLRSSTHVFETINLVISGFPFPVLVTHKRVEVAYRSLFSKMPVFRTVTDSLISSLGLVQADNYSEWMDATTVSVLEPHADPFALNVFPNPVNSSLELNFNMPTRGSSTLRVVDALGAVVLERAIGSAPGDRNQRLDVKNWAPGAYQALITGTDGSRSTKRFVVMH